MTMQSILAYVWRSVQIIALLAIIYWLAAPPPILVTLGAQQTVKTTNSKLAYIRA